MNRYNFLKEKCLQSLLSAIQKNNLNESKESFLKEVNDLFTNQNIYLKQTVIEFTFRGYLQTLISSDQESTFFLEFCLDLCFLKQLPLDLTLILFQEYFESSFSTEKMKKNFSLLEKGINKLKALIKSDEERRIIYTICNGILIRISKSQTPLFYGSVRMFFTNIFPTSTKLLIEKLKIKNDLINQNNNNNNSHYNNETNSQQKEASTGSTNYKLMNNRKRNYSNNPEKQNQNEIESGSESKKLKKKTDKNHNKTNIDNDHRHRHPLDILFEKNNDFKEKLFTLLKRSERILKNLDNKTYKNIYQILKRNTEWYKWEQKNYFDLRKDLIQENEKDRNFRRIKERNLIRNRSFQNKQTFSTDSYRNKKKEWSFVERWSFNFENFEDLTKKPSSEMFLETIIDEINSPFDIEEELKTKNDPKFSWNALRLLRFHQIDLLKRVDDLEEISKRLLLNNDSKNDINEPQIESHKEDQNKMKKSSEKLIQTNTEIAAEDNNSDNQKKKNVKNEGDEIIIKEELENNMDEINENKMVIEKNLKSKGSISKSDRERNEEEKEIKK